MTDIKNFKDIREVFKRFQKDRHNEDKGRNFNMLQEVFSSTEFFDTTKFSLPALKNDIKEDGNILLYQSELLQGVCLPFEVQLIHIEDKQYSASNKLLNYSVYMFLREYSPVHITGTVYQVSDEGRRNLPFTINLIQGTLVIGSSDYKNATPAYAVTPFYTKNELFSTIINTLSILNSLSDKKVLTEIPTVTYKEYYRRKENSTIQSCTKNIHYILGKNDVKGEAYIREHSTGSIEYSHAFTVRGHWRTLESTESIGKDRTGNRNVKGYTWVNEYVKGDGELVKKIREIK